MSKSAKQYLLGVGVGCIVSSAVGAVLFGGVTPLWVAAALGGLGAGGCLLTVHMSVLLAYDL